MKYNYFFQIILKALLKRRVKHLLTGRVRENLCTNAMLKDKENQSKKGMS